MKFLDEPQTVQTYEDFYHFLEELNQDCILQGQEWPNSGTEQYFGALYGICRDIKGLYLNRKATLDTNEPTWQLIAEMLSIARHYE